MPEISKRFLKHWENGKSFLKLSKTFEWYLKFSNRFERLVLPLINQSMFLKYEFDYYLIIILIKNNGKRNSYTNHACIWINVSVLLA